jgi:betaine reductase
MFIFPGKEGKEISMNRILRIVYYLNQFFGAVGGEDKAMVGPEVKSGPVGPATAVANILKDKGEVVATVICGDNYFAEKIEEATQEVIQLLLPYKPDVLIAGPAFNAGRYGVACGAVCKAVQEKLGIPAVTGMYEENPGVDLYRRDLYIIKTGDSVKRMHDSVSKMVNLAYNLAIGQEIGRPDKEGYIRRGLLRSEISDRTAAQRAVDMLLVKLQGKLFETELHLPTFDRVRPAAALRALSSSKIALVTDGGLYPKGNPDKVERSRATKYGRYAIKGADRLDPKDYEVVHSGYDNSMVSKDPNRLVPLDSMRDLEKEGVIGKLNEDFYSTTGVDTSLESCIKIGRGMAEQLKAEGVDGAILTST